MKRLLAIALAFLTLVAGALLAPAATATEKVDVKLLFALNADGSNDELVAVYGSENTVNSSNCKDTKDYISKFTQKDGRNQCLFAKRYEKDSYGGNWMIYSKGDALEFSFLNLTAFIRSDISEAFGIYYSDLNVISSGAAVPLNATVTGQNLSPTVEKGDKFVYYTWEGPDATNSSASIKGTLPLSGATSSPTSDPTSSPTSSSTNTPAPVFTATPSDTPSATATALAAKHNSNDSNTTLYVVLGIAAAAALIVALRWGIGYDTCERSFVNIIATPMGGTHLSGFEQAVVKVMRKQISVNSRALKLNSRDGKIEKDDVLAGLTAVVTVRVPEPQFEGQTKEVLGTAPVRAIVAAVVEKELTALLNSPKRDLKAQARALQEKIVGEMRARVSARMHKEITRRKTALETSTLPAKLADCRSDDVATSELFIVEGDSALGTAKNARNSENQALLPIRGKILNVQKASAADMLHNAECAAIIQVVGAGSGRTFDISSARYGKVILMTDADVDGAHIRTLLLTLFFRYMRPMIEAGRVYAAVPPLHRIEVSAKGRKKKEIIYTYSDEELVSTLGKLEKQGRTFKEPQRYKGLGEMDAHQLAETTMEPQHRMLRRITLADEAAVELAESTFELLMGSSVAPRREFIIDSADEVDRERIDA